MSGNGSNGGTSPQDASCRRNTKIMLVLAVLGLFISVYLVRHHYDPEGSVCDNVLGHAEISCTKVTKSVYSELFHVPVAVFGVVWHVILVAALWRSLDTQFASKSEFFSLEVGIFLWNCLGAVFVVYLILAEVVIGAICPFCTIIHVFTLIMLYISWRHVTMAPHKIDYQTVFNHLKLWALVILLLNAAPILYLNIFAEGGAFTASPNSASETATIAKCLTSSGLVFYGRPDCPFCKRQKGYFGDALQYINYHECKTMQDCAEFGIKGFPTWILYQKEKEMDRVVGLRSVRKLADFVGCKA